MKNLIIAVAAVLIVAGVSLAGNVHKDGNGTPFTDVFTPAKTRSVTHTKAAVSYTPTTGTKVIKIRSTAAAFYGMSSAQNKKDTVGFPLTADTPVVIGIGTRTGTGIAVAKVVFTGASTAAKTIYIQEQ